MPGSHWKGVISFGLVSIPVFLYPAKNKNSDVAFHQIDKKNNARIQYQRINSVTGKKVPWEDIIKGYEYEKDTIIPVPDEIIKKMAGKKSRSIDIDSFIAKQELNLLMLENIYYIVPEKKGQKAYVILENALSETKKVGIAKVVISTKEYLTAILPWKNALILCLLKYPNEVKSADEFDLPENNNSIHKIKPKEMQMAKQLINSMTTKWRPEKYTDEYKKSVQQWMKETVNHLPHKKMAKSQRKIVLRAPQRKRKAKKLLFIM
jgi:DNA end-binding protein Ku